MLAGIYGYLNKAASQPLCHNMSAVLPNTQYIVQDLLGGQQ